MTLGYLTSHGAERLGAAPGLVSYDPTDGQTVQRVYRDGEYIGGILELGPLGIIPLADLRAALVRHADEEARTGQPTGWDDGATTAEIIAGFDAKDAARIWLAEVVYQMERRRARVKYLTETDVG